MDEIKGAQDVVDDMDKFQVSIKVQAKMQTRHNLMQNIQNIMKITNDIENTLNRYALILKSMEEAGEHPHYRQVGDWLVPLTNKENAITEVYSYIEHLEQDHDKHVAQVKAMQEQHDGLTIEIDKLVAEEKGAYEKGKAGIERQKDKMKKRRNR